MKLLLITIDFPLPQNAGGVVRLLGLAEALAEHHDVHLLARERADTPRKLVAELSARLGGAPVETFPAPGAVSGSPPAKLARWGDAIVQRVPPWVLRARCPELERRARELAPSFDAALVLDDNASIYVDALHHVVPVVLDKQNVKGWSFSRSASGWPGPGGRAIHALAAGLYRSFERRSSQRARRVVVTSAAEADRFAYVYGWRPATIPSAIRPPVPAAEARSAGRTVAWLGDQTYAANGDGLVRFLREGWRELGDSGAELLVAGRAPGREVGRLAAELPGVRLLGYVDDLDSLLATCAAGVVPLWAGVGIKMKTLTMMGAGLPLAATPIALEGVAAHDGTHVRIGNSPMDLATALADLLADREAAARMGERGRELILREHTWPVLLTDYERLLEEVVGHA